MYQSIWRSRRTKKPVKGNHRRKSEQGIVKAWVQWKYFWNSFVRRGAIDTTQTNASRGNSTAFVFYRKEENEMKRLVSLLAVCLLLGACGGGNSDAKTDGDAKESFVVGMECNYAPYNYQVENASNTSVSIGAAGNCDGYDVMIASKIAEKLGRTLEIKKLEWDGLQPALQSGEIDAIIAGMTANDEREQGIDFTTPYYDSDMVMIVRKDDALAKATSIQDFTGKNVLGQMNTNYDTVIDQINGVNHMTPKAGYPEMIMALKSGEADALTAEVPVAEGAVTANPELTFVTFAEGKGFEIDNSVSIGLKEGSRGSDFFNEVQAALDAISQDERVEMMQNATNNAPANE